MKRPWLAYLIVSLAACGAGIAISGLPSGGNAELLVLQPITTTTSTTVAPSTTTAPTTTINASTTEPPPSSTTTTSASTTTAAPTTTAVSTTTASTAPPTTTIATTAPPTTTTTTAASSTSTTTAPPTPADTRVAVANGAGVPGIAGDAAELLIEAGFDDVTAVNSEAVDVTTVYFVVGFEAIADLVAVELFIDPDSKADMSELPDLATDEEFDVVAVLGADIGS